MCVEVCESLRACESVCESVRECVKVLIDYKTSMITYSDPRRGYLFYEAPGFSLTLHVVEERRPKYGVAGK